MHASMLSTPQLEGLENHGCAHLGKNAKRFTFNKHWTHEQLDEYLPIIFPIPFQYAASLTKGKSKGVAPPLWVLINKSRQRYEVTQTKNPGGQKVFEYRSRYRAPFAESVMIIGMMFCCYHVHSLILY